MTIAILLKDVWRVDGRAIIREGERARVIECWPSRELPRLVDLTSLDGRHIFLNVSADVLRLVDE